MHMFSAEKGFYGGHGIVGAQVPLGTGLAFANKYRGNDNVSLTYFGDGAANQGQVYESFNMAELWKLPVDLHHREQPATPWAPRSSARRRPPTSIKRGAAFGIPGEQVDGMDVRAVKAAGREGGEMVPRRQGPDHPGDADLPLSRPLDVRPGQVPHHARRSRRCAPSTTRSSRCAQRAAREEMGERGRAEEDRRRGARRSSTRPPNSPPTIPSPIRPSSRPTSTPEAAPVGARLTIRCQCRSKC